MRLRCRLINSFLSRLCVVVVVVVVVLVIVVVNINVLIDLYIFS